VQLMRRNAGGVAFGLIAGSSGNQFRAWGDHARLARVSLVCWLAARAVTRGPVWTYVRRSTPLR
jgi:hypothetical protein